MKRLHRPVLVVFFSLLWLTSPQAESALDLESFFRRVWDKEPLRIESDLSLRRAAAILDYEDRQHLPIVYFDSISDGTNPLLLITSSNDLLSMNGDVMASVVKRLKRGGALKISSAASLSGIHTDDGDGLECMPWLLENEASLVLPLSRDRIWDLSLQEYALEFARQKVARKDGFLKLLQTAAEVDEARGTLRWRRGIDAAALAMVEEKGVLVSQGRSQESALWHAERTLLRARGERLLAELRLQNAESIWAEGGRPVLPDFFCESLLGATTPGLPSASELLPEPLAPELQVLMLERSLDSLKAEADLSALAPVLKFAVRSSVSDNQWAWDGEFGVSINLGGWYLAPPIKTRHWATDARWKALMDTKIQVLQNRRTFVERSLHQVWQSRRDVTEAHHRLLQLRDDLQPLIDQRKTPRSELYDVENELLLLEVEARKLAWQEVQLSFELDLPPWL